MASGYRFHVSNHPLPPYAAELNPVEELWNFEKDKELSNFVPQDVRQLNVICKPFDMINLAYARSSATPLPWDGLTVFF